MLLPTTVTDFDATLAMAMLRFRVLLPMERMMAETRESVGTGWKETMYTYLLKLPPELRIRIYGGLIFDVTAYTGP